MDNAHFQPREIGLQLARRAAPGEADDGVPPAGAGLRFIDPDLLSDLVADMDRWPSIERVRIPHVDGLMDHPEYGRCLEILRNSWTATRVPIVQDIGAPYPTEVQAEALFATPVVNELRILDPPPGGAGGGDLRALIAACRRRRPELRLTFGVPHLPGLRSASRAANLELFDGESDEWRSLAREFDVAVERYLAGELDAEGAGASGSPSTVLGGCPFVEGDLLYITADGRAKPCPVLDAEDYSIGRFEADLGYGTLLNGPEMSRLRHALRLDRRAETPHCAGCPHSLCGILDADSLARFWKGRDEQGAVAAQDERAYIFGRVAPSEHRVTRVDLGCGPVKQPGFVGVDRYALPGVDVVADLDGTLPFEDDSVDLIYASHSLEHVRDILATINEIYRICKHGAQVCIVAPYFNQGLNVANPYHHQVFNEHTPRFWTDARVTPIPAEEYVHPNSPDWGLSRSDNSFASVDIRCVKMEWFYFPQYRGLPEARRREARSRGFDVCDQIMYHLLVVKTPVTDEEFLSMASRVEYYMPSHVQIRALREENEDLRRERDALNEAHATERSELQGLIKFHSKSSQALLGRLDAAARSEEELKALLAEARVREEQLQGALATLTSGTSWRLAQLLVRMRHRLAPRDSMREQVGRRLMRLQRQLRASLRGMQGRTT